VTRILLDTHAFLWFIFDDARLSPKAVEIIEDSETTKVLSVVSLWEIAIKAQIGKLRLGMPLADFFERHVAKHELEMVGIEMGHLLAYDALPLIHRDPFDRLLVAKARVMNIPIMSADAVLSRYGVETLW
jgi:PIN domain nuclease of toxin-antitoxin system